MFRCILLSILFFTSCGNLPRTARKDQAAPPITATALTGLVIHSTDRSYSHTAIYFYELSAGKISLLTSAESGDTFSQWLNGKMYLFNRANRVNYSTFLPRSGISSRSAEHINADLSESDPVSAAVGPNGELILGMNRAQGLLFIDESDFTTTAKLGDPSFRPSDIWIKDSTVFVTHQALDSQYRATGGGKVYAASKNDGTWSFPPTSYDLTVTNPVYVGIDSDHKAIIGGVCYRETGTSCMPGVDRFDPNTGQATHISSWDASKWYPNGEFYTDLNDDTLLACVIETSTQKNVIARYKIDDGSMTKLFELSGPVCAGVIADRTGMKIFVGQTVNGTTGSITVLDSNGTVQATATMDSGISGLTASFD